jgi:hypothetical protein
MRWEHFRCAAVALALGSIVGGCASPRIVRAISRRGDEVKFLYLQGSDTGIIKCTMAPDGSLSACHPMSVELEP